MRNKIQAGFTLTELTLAIAIFSFLLIIVVSMTLLFLHQYQQGQVSRDVQENARSAMEVMVRSARGATAAQVVASGGNDRICIATGQAVWQAFYISGTVLYSGTSYNANCSSPGNATPLTSGSVQAARLNGQIVGNNNLVIDLNLASNVNLLNAGHTACDPTKGSVQQCTLTALESSVDLRGFNQ